MSDHRPVNAVFATKIRLVDEQVLAEIEAELVDHFMADHPTIIEPSIYQIPERSFSIRVVSNQHNSDMIDTNIEDSGFGDLSQLKKEIS